jgi:hypothetical protein
LSFSILNFRLTIPSGGIAKLSETRTSEHDVSAAHSMSSLQQRQVESSSDWSCSAAALLVADWPDGLSTWSRMAKCRNPPLTTEPFFQIHRWFPKIQGGRDDLPAEKASQTIPSAEAVG